MNQSNSVGANTDSREADSRSTGNYDYSAREAVGVFADPAALERAVDELEIAGFDRAALSVLATDGTIKDRVGHLYRNVAEIEDNRHVPQAAFAEMNSRVEGEAAAVGIPFYIGSVAGAGVTGIGLGATGIGLGATAAATVAGAVVGGVAGVGLGAVLAGVMIWRRAEQVKEQLAQGGMVLWVNLRDPDAERRALQILEKAGARDIHVHEFEREWTLKDRPLSDVQFDPFLWWPGDRGRE
jgi:hypothetical protein